MFLPILVKPTFLTLLVAYLVGENALIILPLISAGFLGLSWARGAYIRALLLIFSLILGTVLGIFANSLPLTLYFLVLVGLTILASIFSGVTVGLVLRNYTWGRCLFIITSIIFIASVTLSSIYWDELRRDITISINARIAEIRELVSSSDSKVSGETSSMISLLRYLDCYWEDFHLGLLFAQSLVVSLILLGALITRLRVIPTEDGRNFWSNPNIGSFSRVRPPEHLVWLAIVSALVLLYDSHYGVSELLRLLARNLAVGLSFIYWANGLSILFFVTELFSWNVVVMLIVVLFIFGFWSFPVLAIFGFFDTWWEFRKRLETLYTKMKTTNTTIT